MDQVTTGTVFKVPTYSASDSLRSKSSEAVGPRSEKTINPSFNGHRFSRTLQRPDHLDFGDQTVLAPPSVGATSIHEDGAGFYPRSPRASSPSITAYKRSSWNVNGVNSVTNGLSGIPVLAPPPSAPFATGSPTSRDSGVPISPSQSPSPQIGGSPVNRHFSTASNPNTGSAQNGVPRLVVSESDTTSTSNDDNSNTQNGGPFNFQSTYATSSPKVSHTSQRRGHRYKHSSVSLNFFQEPPPRAPLPIPKSLPIPTLTECYQSMSKEQKIRLAWCGVHFFVAYLVYNCDMPFTALSALAHLLLYDAVSATLSVAVDVLCNFDVWKQSSIHHPFGLERIEVLAGYALVVSLVFMGGDIMSHALQDMIQSLYARPGEHIHSHGKTLHNHANSSSVDFHDSLGWFGMVFRVILGIVVTLVSAVGLDNHSRISVTLIRANSFFGDLEDPADSKVGDASGGNFGLSSILRRVLGTRLSSFLPTTLSNPSNLMTVAFSVALLFFPLLGASGYKFVDTLLTPLMSASMCYIGWNLAKSLAGMLIMSYPGDDHIDEIAKTISRESAFVESISDISLWQVHHDLWLASMKIVMSGTDDDEDVLRQRACETVKQYMDDGSGTVWQTTIDITRTTLVN